MKTDKELLEHVEKIIWDVNVPDHEKVLCMQNMLYQRGANLDRKSIDMFGDVDTYPYEPNMRRV